MQGAPQPLTPAQALRRVEMLVAVRIGGRERGPLPFLGREQRIDRYRMNGLIVPRSQRPVYNGRRFQARQVRRASGPRALPH